MLVQVRLLLLVHHRFLSEAPSPEIGFIQPHAQYERPANGDPNGGLASSGPVTSKRLTQKTNNSIQWTLIREFFMEQPVTFDEIATTVFKLGILDENGNLHESFEDLAGLDRVDPRFFRFPDGKGWRFI